MKYARIAAFVIAFCLFAGALLNAAYRYFLRAGLWQPRIACNDSVQEFGDVPANSRFPCQFRIENLGNRPLVIRDVKVGCRSCLEVLRFPKEPLSPDSSGVIEVALSTKDLKGDVTKGLVVRSNDPQQPALVLRVTAHVDEPDVSNVQTEVGDP